MWLACATTDKVKVTFATSEAGTTISVLDGDGTYAAGDTDDEKWLISPDDPGETRYLATSDIPGTTAAVTEAVPTTNDPAGDWLTPNNARANGTSVATTDAINMVCWYHGYNFTAIPSDAVIHGITVRLDAFKDAAAGNELTLGVRLSWDGGTSWTAQKETSTLNATTETTKTLGAVDDVWGHTWTLVQLGAADFRVEVESLGVVDASPVWSLDWIPVTVTYEHTFTEKQMVVTLSSYTTAPVQSLGIVAVKAAEAK